MKGLKYFVVFAGVALIAATAVASNIPAAGDPLWVTCAMAGTNYGLPIVFDGVADNAFVQSYAPNGPSNEIIYRAQLWFDPATWDAPDGSFFVFARATQDDHPGPGGTTVPAACFQLMLVKKSGLWRLWARALNGNVTTQERFTNRINLLPGSPSLIQVEWTRSDVAGQFNGHVTVSVLDGYASGQTQTIALNNYFFNVDRFNLGAMQTTAAMTGHICMDEFASFRTLAP